MFVGKRLHTWLGLFVVATMAGASASGQGESTTTTTTVAAPTTTTTTVAPVTLVVDFEDPPYVAGYENLMGQEGFYCTYCGPWHVQPYVCGTIPWVPQSVGALSWYNPYPNPNGEVQFVGKGTSTTGGSGGGSARKPVPPTSGQVTLRADFYAGPEHDFPLYQGSVYCLNEAGTSLAIIYTCSASTFVDGPPPRQGNWALSPRFYDAGGVELRDARDVPTGYRFDGVAGFDDLPRETWWRMGVTFDTTTGRIMQYTSKNLITGEAWTMDNPQALHDYGAGPVPVDVYASGGAGVKDPVATVGFYNVGNGQLSLYDNVSISNEGLPPETDTPPPPAAPMWVYGWPMAEAITNAGVTVRANINEDGTAYYVVLADGAPTPTPAAIKAGSGAMRWGSMALTANTESTADIIRLYPETSLDIWIVAEDGDSNLQACPRKFDVTTTTGPPPLLGGAIFMLR